MQQVSVWTYFIGPFAGAFLAFFLARIYDANRRYLERLAAANFALMTLKNQFNDFTLFRRNFYEECSRAAKSKHTPVWALIRPSVMEYGEYTFDYEAISFLFESGTRPYVFEAIELAQIVHRDFQKLDKHRTETALQVQRLLAKEDKNSEMTLQQAEGVIGKAYLIELDMLAHGLAMRASDNEETYLKAFKGLRAALRCHFKSTWRYRIGYLWRCRHDLTIEKQLVQQRPRLEPGFNLDELPPFPAQLQARVEATHAERKAMKVKFVPKAEGVT